MCDTNVRHEFFSMIQLGLVSIEYQPLILIGSYSFSMANGHNFLFCKFCDKSSLQRGMISQTKINFVTMADVD